MLIFFVACRRQQSVSTPLNAAERILKDNPDSAFRIIQSIPYPDKLDKEDLVRWCLIAGKAADKLNTSLPPSYYFDHAYSWLIKYGITKDQVDIGLFWGRSLVADGEYDKAMSIYAEVLAIAKEKRKSSRMRSASLLTSTGQLFATSNMMAIRRPATQCRRSLLNRCL